MAIYVFTVDVTYIFSFILQLRVHQEQENLSFWIKCKKISQLAMTALANYQIDTKLKFKFFKLYFLHLT